MAYKIEDIDWDEMPEGAVEFGVEADNTIKTVTKLCYFDTQDSDIKFIYWLSSC